jgi:two-component system sensor histidine kinase CpxA
MRTLFVKLLVWFLATIVIMTIGFALFENIDEDPGPGPQRRLARFFLNEAGRIYRMEGSTGLLSYLQRIESTYGGKGILVDSAGRDLSTGADRSELIRAAEEAQWPWFSRGPISFLYTKSDDGHWFFLQVLRADEGGLLASQRVLLAQKRFVAQIFAPERLWLIAAVLALCCLLAHNLTAPLRSLRSAVERFGKGDFTARSNSDRRDEFGDLARTFDGMAKQIQSLLDKQQNLLRDISHELRSPLTRLNLAVELARSGSDRFQALDRIEREASRLNTLVGELLCLARMESRQPALQLTTVRLDEMVVDLVDICFLEASSRGCVLQLNSDLPVNIEADEELLRRALENVIRNALHHAPKDTEVSLTLNQEAETTSIRIRDFGPGVPSEFLSRIFDPFWRVDQDRSREKGGAGLGLAIARHAVQAHSGEILVRNVDPGLEVEIRLPHHPKIDLAL